MDEALRQLLTLSRGYFEKKQWAEAEKYLTQVVEQNQSFADVYNMLGVVYHDQGQFARAQRAFEAALRINPAYTDAALNLAIIYNDLGKYREAKEVYSAAMSRQRATPNKMDPYVRGKIANMYADIANVFASSGMLDEAIAEYRRALELGPTFVDIRLKLADALRDQGEHHESLKEFEAILKANPNYLPGRVHYGITLYSAGRKADAIAIWEDVLARNPGNKSAEMYLRLVRDPGKEATKDGANG
ncbi:MAG: tetratricopeptide repeat protein [Myxococcales bacterium]|nr:tetratricopeptide repeat protein [Myxococcales bacterium]